MTQDIQDQELAREIKKYYDEMIGRGFSPGQITIMSIMITISQYVITKGVGSGISLMTACLNSIMSGDEINITKIKGYQDNLEEELSDDWLEENEYEEAEYIVEGNVLYHDFKPKED
tara:strand:- start:702 stop:1052 length:351 start_codon:yes stop_codon:yes gene_type:complete